MKVIVRTYSGPGAKELFEIIAANMDEVKTTLQTIDGFVSYMAANTAAGGVTVTVCQDDAGIEQSVQRAREWVEKNAAHTGASAPSVVTGTVI